MKSTQLANILIKIAGLYICLLAIPNTISGIMVVFSSVFGQVKWDEAIIRLLSYSIGTGVQAAVGIFVIVKSRKIAEFFFKNEDE
jgi:hypothetical protein